MSTPALGIMVERYIALRDAKAQLEARFKQKKAPITEAMDKLEASILDHMNSTGMESCRTAAGTAYKSTDNRATVADWEAFLAYVRQHELWHMLEHRVSKPAVEEFVTANNDLPPGVNWSSEVCVNIRRG